jgi:uncharacterized delta-60 repeat protein
VAAAAIALTVGVGVASASFAGDGFETLDFGGVDSPLGIAIQTDGKIVVGGSTTAGATLFDFAVARFEKGGDVDTSFAGDGRQTTEFGDFDSAQDLSIHHGKIVLAGTTDIGGANDLAVARYRKGGSPDGSFSGDGKQTTGFNEGAGARGVAIQRDGKIVVVGSKGDDFLIVRYREGGSLDETFSGDGKKTTNFGGFDSAEAVAVQDNGRIVVAGSSCVGGGMDCRENVALARYKANGGLDKSFSGDGMKKADLGGSDGARDLALQDNGRIVIAGAASPNDDADFVVARFKTKGGLDKKFGKNGKRRTDFGDSDTADGLAIQDNGNIVLVGTTQATPTVDFALARYTSGGNLDDAFSGDGKQTTDVGDSGNAALAVAFQSRRKFVLTGGVSGAQDFVVARYKGSGKLDD